MKPATSLPVAWIALEILAVPSLAQIAEPDAHLLLQSTLGAAGDRFGYAVCPLGDVNGDTKLDFAASAPWTTVGGQATAGVVYALSGADGSVLWSRSGTGAQNMLGLQLAALDWNADGVLDLAATRLGGFTTPEQVLVFSGTDGTTLATLVGPHAFSGFGSVLATGGDLNGDETDDLLVAAPSANTAVGGSTSGRVLAYSPGSTTPILVLDPPFGSDGAQLGRGLAFVGDTDVPPDGRDEFVASAYAELLLFGWNGSGAALRYQVSGFSLSGGRIAGGGDVDGDGQPDFAVAGVDASVVRIYSGLDGGLRQAFYDQGEAGNFEEPAFLGDVDGDGRADVAVGAWTNSSGASGAGKVFVYSGASGTLLKTITALTAGRSLGSSLAPLGDLDGDGQLDLIVGTGFSGLVPGSALVFSTSPLGPRNTSYPAALAGDPGLADAGGDLALGPRIGDALEPFNLALDCSGAASNGLYSIGLRLGRRATPLALLSGSLWLTGAHVLVFRGFHTRNTVLCAPSSVILPSDPSLIGVRFTAQGQCSGRLSNALVQTIGG